MFGLALSLIVLIATLSVMNGFERDIRDKLLSRTPHITALGTHQLDPYSLPLLEPFLKKTEKFYHTKMLLADYGYLQVTVIFSDSIVEPKISTALLSHVSSIKPLKLLYFSSKKALFNTMPSLITITPLTSVEDDQLDIFLPLSEKDRFTGLIVTPMQGIWLNNPMLVDQSSNMLRSYYPTTHFVTWRESYASLFEALTSEKRLIFVVLSLLIVLIYVQLGLTLLLIFKEKEKDMVALYFFFNGWSSVYRIFFYYGLFNVVFGTFLGCLGGYCVALYLPDMIMLLEKIFHCTVLPYEQYYSKHLPSEVRWDDILFIGSATLIAGTLAAHLIAKSVLSKKIDQLLRHNQ